ncbi:MAG: L-seryl-tRNA(Sec) selenium transferase, partial [Acidobacteriota bacterium]|nr:L-seryl-tRNA(Sec) selenium transferase [Acidobacteriota bacterium]
MDPEPPRPPAMDRLLESATGKALAARHGRARAKEALREAAAGWRASRSADGDAADAILAAAARDLETRLPAGPRRVVNATGVLLHTNLGRAPLAREAVSGAERAAGFSTLEYDLAEGTRGKRGEHVRPLVLALFAPGRDDLDALAVTNAAAALLLALDTLANGRPVAVSRGELVAIGGDFRVPAILAKSGASLHEVGTTNRTAVRDYEEALDAGAAAILKVRPSNYRIVGFTEEVRLSELAVLAHARGVPVIFDAGAATPTRLTESGLSDEPVPLDALDAGADLVCFSGDKLLGGPQAGILIGRAELVARAAANPLARALRPDKLVLGALAATLDLHLSGRRLEVPFFRMLEAPLASLRVRAEALAARARVAGFEATVVDSIAVAGGGAGAESTLPSQAVSLAHPVFSADGLAAALRASEPPVIARIEEGRVLLDLRSVAESEDEEIARALER